MQAQAVAAWGVGAGNRLKSKAEVGELDKSTGAWPGENWPGTPAKKSTCGAYANAVSLTV